ncbi:MAG: hypothetical protein SPL15_01500 [Lachnospiraceae bacterium]|nr:hypothetical protein [Lachnospiraceae bacterium]MDY5741664.1 hypothetical protein [Lachnospiraceae bacterium]
MGLNGLFENSLFKILFHEAICILAILYFLAPLLTALREKKEGRPISHPWNSQKNIVALYVTVAEPVFLYGDIQSGRITQLPLAIISQIAAMMIVILAYLVLRTPTDRHQPRGPITKHKWSK